MQIDLLWEANTTTPPLYKGLALPSPESSVRVVAIASYIDETGRQYSNDELLFRWEQNGLPIEGGATLGNNIVEIEAGNYLTNSQSIRVFVRPITKNEAGSAVIRIPFVETEVLFYEESSIYGRLFNLTLGRFNFFQPRRADYCCRAIILFWGQLRV